MALIHTSSSFETIPLRKGIKKKVFSEIKTDFLDPTLNNIQFLYNLHENSYNLSSLKERLPSLYKNISSYEKHDQNELNALFEDDVSINISLECQLSGYITNFGQIRFSQEIDQLIADHNKVHQIQRIWLERTPYAYWKVNILIRSQKIILSKSYMKKQYKRQVLNLLEKYNGTTLTSKNAVKLRKRILKTIKKARKDDCFSNFLQKTEDIIILDTFRSYINPAMKYATSSTR